MKVLSIKNLVFSPKCIIRFINFWKKILFLCPPKSVGHKFIIYSEVFFSGFESSLFHGGFHKLIPQLIFKKFVEHVKF